MANNLGKPLMERESDIKGVILKRAIFTLLGLGFLVFAVYMGFFAETEAVWASILLAVIICTLGLGFLAGSFMYKKQRTILYEEGVFVANGRREYHLHFSDIIGLSDEAGLDVVMSGGIVEVLVASVVVAAAGKIADAHNLKHRIRPMNIWTEIEGERKSLSVVKSTGDVLSQLYTKWLIAQKSITTDNLHTLVLPFADKLELNQGIFILTHVYGGGETTLRLADITDINYENHDLRLCTTDDRGRVKPIIELPINLVYNLDLLHYIYNLQNNNQF